jgi:hypothetical protein
MRTAEAADQFLDDDLLSLADPCRMSGEAIKHQDDMKQQNDALSNMVTELTNGKP